MTPYDQYRAQIESASVDALPTLVGELEALKAAAWRRLIVPRPDPTITNQADRFLTIPELATKLGQSRDWLYRHADQLPFATRIGRQWRFSERGAERWMKARHTA